MDLVYAAGGCLLFSGYIVYDTYNINNRLSPDEYIMAAISLYLEYVLHIYILRTLTNLRYRQLHQPLWVSSIYVSVRYH